VLDSPPFEAHDHGLLHTQGSKAFSTRVGQLEYTGNLDTKTHVLNVDIYAWIPFIGQVKVGHGSGNLANKVFVRLDKAGVVTGHVEFYDRGGSGTAMWAKSKFVLFGKEYNYDKPVVNIPEDFIPQEAPLLEAEEYGLAHTVEEQTFDIMVHYLQYVGILNPETLALSVDIHAKVPFMPAIPLGRADGNLADGVTFQFVKAELGAKGSAEFYIRDGDRKQMWAREKYTFLWQEYKWDTPVLRIQQDDTAPISLQSQSHGLAHIQGEVPFSKRVGPLGYSGTFQTSTRFLIVDVFGFIPIIGRIHLGHAEGNIDDGVRVPFSTRPIQGSVEFSARDIDSDSTQILSSAEFTMFGQEYRYSSPVLDIANSQDDIFALEASFFEVSSVPTLDSSFPSDVTIGPLQYSDTLDLVRLVLTVDVHLKSDQTLLGHAEGNVKKGVKLELKGSHDSTHVAIGWGKFYVEGINQVWAKSNLDLDGNVDYEDEKLFNLPWLAQTQQHAIDSESFDVKAWPLQYTGTLDTYTLTVSVDVYLWTFDKSRTLLGHTDGSIVDGVEFEFAKDGVAEGQVSFYIRSGRSMWAESELLLDGRVYRDNVPVLDIWQDNNEQHLISTLDMPHFNKVVGPLQYTGILDPETHILNINVDVLDVPDNLHLGTEEGPLRHNGGVLVEFDRPGVATGKVLFYEKGWEVWAMARFTLYGKLYRSNAAVWEIPE
jgi:hypothetical protein